MDTVSNADIARRLMRHTSLQTTTKYMREVPDRMQDAVKNLGATLEATLGGNSDRANWVMTPQNNFLVKLALERLEQLKQQKLNEISTCQKHDENTLTGLSAT